jgi:hypothetical protein
VNVDAQETATVRTADGIEPIRTPDAYTAAIDRALALLSETLAARRRGEDAEALALEAQALSEAISNAPFETRGREVVAKGFTPRIVR